MRGIRIAATALLIGAASPPPAAPDWAYLALQPPPSNRDERVTLPGSRLTVTRGEARSITRAVDWFPERHGPVPKPVVDGGRDGAACGTCHLLTGQGRPENAAIAGLPAAYIEAQVRAFVTGERAHARAWVGANSMISTAQHVSAADVSVAADYFAHQPYRPHLRVAESATAPNFEVVGTALKRVGGSAPIAGRIVELADDFEQHEIRSPDVFYTAYVPPGSVASGRRLAARGGPGGLPCAGCHGAGLRGGEVGPPLAGRWPGYLARQLFAFRAGTRRSEAAAPMRAVAGELSNAQVVALSAYAASLRP
jgi:cytochrome c553